MRGKVIRMKKTMLVMAMVIALALSTMGGAFAKNAPGNGNDNGAIKGVAFDGDQEVEYLFNRAGYHFWFTATAWGGSAIGYEAGDQYHNIYKYEVDDPTEWCATTRIPDREPYNLGGTAGMVAYYKIWNVTDDVPLCGTFDVASGDVTYVPSGDHRTDATFEVSVSEDGAGGTVSVSNHWQGLDRNVNFTGDVTCTERVGDVMYFAGDILTYENVTTSPTAYFYFSIQDSDPDLIRVLRSDEPKSCDYAGTPLREVVAGGLTID